MKRLLSLLATLSLVLALATGLSLNAAAESGKAGELDWKLSGTTLTISGKGAMPVYTGSAQVPWISGRMTITTVKIENGVTSIAPYAFYCYEALTKVSIPEGVTAIGDMAFLNCHLLDTVNFPKSLLTIGKASFCNCTKLKNISLYGTTVAAEDAFTGCTLKEVTVHNNGKEKVDTKVFGTSAKVKQEKKTSPVLTVFLCVLAVLVGAGGAALVLKLRSLPPKRRVTAGRHSAGHAANSAASKKPADEAEQKTEEVE